MKRLLVFITLAIVAIATAGLAAGETTPLIGSSRPANAPVLHSPAQNSIEASLAARGAARIIVRLAPPADLPQGFIPEGELSDAAAVQAQRAAIARGQSKVGALLSHEHLAEAKRFPFIPFMALEVDRAEYEALLALPEIDLIEEDLPLPLSLSESVPLIGAVGNLFNGYSGSGQMVAILDTGVDKAHPFLTGKVVSEACYSTTSRLNGSTALCKSGSTLPGAGGNCSPTLPGCEHGTHVAGIAAGKGASFSGVARDANIIAIQVFSQFDTAQCGVGATGPCIMSYISDQVSALQRVYDLRSTYSISAANLSLGGGAYASYCDSDSNVTSEKAAIDALRSVGIATVIASGNDANSSGISAPACISSAISVGATSKSDVVASYSNSASFLNLLAPGSSIYSSVPGTGYAYLSGTSMATPHVTGAWAVIKSAKPAASVTEVLDALASTGVPVTDSRNGLVKPRIRVDSAINALSTHMITASVDGGNGTIASANPVSVTGGQTATFALAPAAGYHTGTPTGGTCPTGSLSGTSYTTGAITADCSVIFSFAPNTYTIGTAMTGNGSLTCTPGTTVSYNTVTSCNATPAAGSYLTAVTVDAVAQTVANREQFTYSFGPVTADHSISATFAAVTPPGAPTIGSATAGNGEATVTFSPPASDGGSSITSYTVISNPGGMAVSGPASPLKLTGLNNGTAYTFTVTATNGAGTGPLSSPSNSVTPNSGSLSLTASLTGAGWGTVSSNPAGITCTTGSSSGCTASFVTNSAVTLTPLPRWDSLFTGWGGGCSGTGPCSIGMSSTQSVSAGFSLKQNARVGASYFASLQAAYGAITAAGTIEAGVDTFVESLLFNGEKEITLSGGKDSSFLSTTGFTTVDGSLTISAGTLTVSELVIR
nr:S8 family serine peptidase [Geotalea sp. SG265]